MIRPATAADLDELYRLWCELMDFHRGFHPAFGYDPAAETDLKNQLRHRLLDPLTQILVVEAEAGLAGMLVVTYQPSPAGVFFARRGYIGETVVSAAHRGKGIGLQLFRAGKAWLAAQGADHLELQVAVKNVDAQRFWESHGFTATTQHLVLPLRGQWELEE